MLGSRVRAATTTLAQALDISEGEWVFQIERLRIAYALPLSMETCSFPAELFPGLLDQPLTGSLYELLEKRYGIKRAKQWKLWVQPRLTSTRPTFFKSPKARLC
jgi:GntR family transcriptional regulator